MSRARILTVVEPRHLGPHRLLFVRALEQVYAERLGQEVTVVDLDPAAAWTVDDLSPLAADVVEGVGGTVAEWLQTWVEGEDPANLMRFACFDGTGRRSTVPGSLHTEDLGARLAEGAARRGFMMSPAAHLLGALAQARVEVDVIVLVCGAGLHPVARVALAVADATLVLVNADPFVKTDMQRVEAADLVAAAHGDGLFGHASVAGVWFEQAGQGALTIRRSAWAQRAKVAHRVRLRDWSAGPPSAEILDQVQALNPLR
jgi:hypothetical protein